MGGGVDAKRTEIKCRLRPESTVFKGEPVAEALQGSAALICCSSCSVKLI